MGNNDIIEIENKIGYSFRNKELLLRAFTHSSYSNEHRNVSSYERLEFLGDAALGFITALDLYQTYPSYSEGQLSKIRAGTVDRNTIAGVVDEMDIVRYIRTGSGNAQENFRTSIKARCDLFEAVVGAIVVDNDGKLEQATEFLKRFLFNHLNLRSKDYKSRLYELCSRENKEISFVVSDKTVHENKPVFTVELYINGEKKSIGKGGNIKSAEQEASKAYLQK